MNALIKKRVNYKGNWSYPMCVLWWHRNSLVNVGYSRWGWFDKSNEEVSKDHFDCKVLNKFSHYKFAAFARHIWQEARTKAKMWVDVGSTFEGFNIVMALVPFLWRRTRVIKSIDCIFLGASLLKRDTLWRMEWMILAIQDRMGNGW